MHPFVRTLVIMADETKVIGGWGRRVGSSSGGWIEKYERKDGWKLWRH